jgi:serine/threonine-protein kinase HipA
VQLKFSALAESTGGLTIPASGVGGDWIIKLPAQNFAHIPENEWAMLHFAGGIGIPVPETRLVPLEQISGLPRLGGLSGKMALAVKRFDREGKRRIHIEDFAQVYNVFPEKNMGESARPTSPIWSGR